MRKSSHLLTQNIEFCQNTLPLNFEKNKYENTNESIKMDIFGNFWMEELLTYINWVHFEYSNQFFNT